MILNQCVLCLVGLAIFRSVTVTASGPVLVALTITVTKTLKWLFIILKFWFFLLYSHDWLKPNWMVNFDFPHNSSDLISKIQLPKNPKSKNITAAVTFFLVFWFVSISFFSIYTKVEFIAIFEIFRDYEVFWMQKYCRMRSWLTILRVAKKPSTKNL